MREVLWVTKALADENRLRILLLLDRGELCVCQVIAVIGLAPSTISKHMSILHQAGLVESRKAGRWVYYQLARSQDNPMVHQALDWVVQSAGDSPQTLRDLAALAEVVRVDPEELCQLQASQRAGIPLTAAVAPTGRDE